MSQSFHTLLERGVAQILPAQSSLEKLLTQRKIRLYLGIDPTGNQLHLGHAVVLRKLQQFAEAGHEVILLIGNGTVKIGDPTGKDKTRPMLTDQQIEENFKTWKEQASKILDFSKIEIRHNGDWFEKMSFSEMIQLFAQMTIQQLLERDMFQERMKNEQPIFTHEILYPILQGYDSVQLDVDLEIGGNDQLFNMMVGRQMMGTMKQKEKWVLTVPLLVGTNGNKMGKSEGNFIGLMETPENMFGKIMSIVDEVIVQYFELLTDISSEELATMKDGLADGTLHPMEAKKKLALILTTTYHSQEAAQAAADHFAKTVQRKELPETLPTLALAPTDSLLDAVLATKVPESKSEARRLFEQGAVTLNEEKMTENDLQAAWQSGDILKVGKRHFFTLQGK